MKSNLSKILVTFTFFFSIACSHGLSPNSFSSGDPSDPNRLSGTPMNSMFISQEDSKSDEWNPGNSQNQGTEGSSIPRKIPSSGKKDSSKIPEKQPKNMSIDERMKRLTNLIENVEK